MYEAAIHPTIIIIPSACNGSTYYLPSHTKDTWVNISGNETWKIKREFWVAYLLALYWILVVECIISASVFCTSKYSLRVMVIVGCPVQICSITRGGGYVPKVTKISVGHSWCLENFGCEVMCSFGEKFQLAEVVTHHRQSH